MVSILDWNVVKLGLSSWEADGRYVTVQDAGVGATGTWDQGFGPRVLGLSYCFAQAEPTASIRQSVQSIDVPIHLNVISGLILECIQNCK
jgi:hypothetical protein